MYVRTQLAQLCPDHPLRQGHPTREAAQTAGTLKAFCGSYVGSVEREQGALLALPASDPLVEAYGATALLLESLSNPETQRDQAALVQQLAALVDAPDAGMGALVAAEALQQVGTLTPATRATLRSSGTQLTREDANRAQLLAAQMRLCRSRGGCGPGQVMSLHYCAAVLACTPGITADAVWRRMYSPNVYGAAMKIAARG
jgi:hypothetical protein